MTHFFEIDRSIKGSSTVSGFVVDYSESFILVHSMDLDVFQLNGYIVVRIQDVKNYRTATRANWILKAINHFGCKPVKPREISLESEQALLNSIATQYPLLTFRPERKRPDVCFIGSLISVTPDAVVIKDIDSNGEWTRPRRIKLSDITRIDFGDGYATGLAAAAGLLNHSAH
jgi:hypothetical protein